MRFDRALVSLVLLPLLLVACAGASAPSAPASPEGAAAPVDGEASARASQALLEKALEGFGGAERVDGLRTMVVDSTLVREQAEGRLTEIRQRSYVEFPDRFRREAVLEGMTVASVVAPAGGFVVSPFGTLPLPDEERIELERSFARSPLSLLRSRGQEDFTATAEGEGEIDGRQVGYLRIELGGDANRLAIDRQTGRVHELRFTDRRRGAAQGEGREVVIRFDNQRNAEGMIYPFESVTTREGEATVTRRVHSLEVNVELDPALFEPPEEVVE